MAWEPLFTDLATETTLVQVKEAVENLANSGLATEAEQIALRTELLDSCRTLIRYEKQASEQLRHVVAENGDRFHFRAAGGASFSAPVWEVVHFDNTNDAVHCYENQVWTDWAELPADATTEERILAAAPSGGLQGYWPMNEAEDSTVLADVSGVGLAGSYGGSDNSNRIDYWLPTLETSAMAPLLGYRWGPGDIWSTARVPVDVGGWTALTAIIWIKSAPRGNGQAIGLDRNGTDQGDRAGNGIILTAGRSVDQFRIQAQASSQLDFHLITAGGGTDRSAVTWATNVGLDDQLHMLAVKWGPGTGRSLRTYLDGVYQSQGAVTTGTAIETRTDGEINFGAQVHPAGHGVSDPFAGAGLGTFLLWDTELTDQQILDIYNAVS